MARKAKAVGRKALPVVGCESHRPKAGSIMSTYLTTQGR